MVTMEIIIEQTDRLCWRKRGRVRERGRQREKKKKTTGEEERKETMGGKVAEMFVGIPQKTPSPSGNVAEVKTHVMSVLTTFSMNKS